MANKPMWGITLEERVKNVGPVKEGECGARASLCVCRLPKGHSGPHHCTDGNCGGKWEGDFDGKYCKVVAFPGSGDL